MIAHPIWWTYSKKLSGINTLSCNEGSMGLGHEWPWRARKEFLVLTDQYNIEIFSYGLRLLPSCSSIHHQTNIESTQIRSEDHLSVSRIRSSHLLRGKSPCRRWVFILFCHWVRLIELSSWFNTNPCSFMNRYSPWRWASSGRSSRFCVSLWWACKRKYFRLRFRGFLLVVVVLVQSMRNSDPRVRIV